MSGICSLLDKFNQAIINPLLLLFFAAGTLVFIWGIVEFLWGLNTDTEHKENGRRHMLWGLVGMFIMVCAYSFLKLIAATVGGNLSCLG